MKITATKAASFLAAAIVAVQVQGVCAQTVLVKDGSFKNWIFGSWGTGSGGGVMTRLRTVGDPAPALSNTTITGSGEIGLGFGIDDAHTTVSPLQGLKFTLKIYFESGPGAFGQGQGIDLIVAQGPNVYSSGELGATNTNSTWTQLTFEGTLSSANFSLVSGSGPATPDFTSRTPTRFGIGGDNYQSGTLTNYYDKFSLVIE